MREIVSDRRRWMYFLRRRRVAGKQPRKSDVTPTAMNPPNATLLTRSLVQLSAAYIEGVNACTEAAAAMAMIPMRI